MNRSHLSETATTLANRIKAAGMGFGITMAPLGAIAMAQLAFIPQIVGTIEGLDVNEQALAISTLRGDWLTFHTVAAALVAIYWLLTAVFGKGQLLQLRAANVTLALFLFALVLFTLYGSFVQWPEDLKRVCPFLGVSDTYTQPYALDEESCCDIFVYAAHLAIILGLFGLSAVLLVTSVLVRIASSRRVRSANR